MNKPPLYNNRIVAFIDILGFSALVSSLSSQPELHGRLHNALSLIKSYRETSQTENTAHSNLEVSVFSDSIVISSEEMKYFEVLWACGWLQAQLLYSGIMIRGGISLGKTVHRNDILYGEGVLKAYRIESNAAVYPRIVIEPSLLPLINVGIKSNFLEEDSDGLWFINPFSFDAMADGAAELAADGYDPREIYFAELGKHIDIGIKKAKYADHLSKWTWLRNRYLAASEEYLRTRETKPV